MVHQGIGRSGIWVPASWHSWGFPFWTGVCNPDNFHKQCQHPCCFEAWCLEENVLTDRHHRSLENAQELKSYENSCQPSVSPVQQIWCLYNSGHTPVFTFVVTGIWEDIFWKTQLLQIKKHPSPAACFTLGPSMPAGWSWELEQHGHFSQLGLVLGDWPCWEGEGDLPQQIWHDLSVGTTYFSCAGLPGNTRMAYS